MSEEPTVWPGPTLHGPSPACWYEYVKRLDTWRVCGYRLDLSHYRLSETGEWVHDYSSFIPLTFPPARPDYEPGELSKIEAAEAKRAKRESRAIQA